MPRTMSDPIWNHWTVVYDMGRQSKVECKYCESHSQLRNAPKCKTHTINCSKAPIHVRNKFRQQRDAKLELKQEMSVYANHSNDVPQLSYEDSHASHPSEEDVGVDPQLYNVKSEELSLRDYSPLNFIDSHLKKRRTNESVTTNTTNSIARYIDCFHRVKEDMNYLLTQTTTERKREFLSYALEVMAENMSLEDKQHLFEEIKKISHRS